MSGVELGNGSLSVAGNVQSFLMNDTIAAFASVLIRVNTLNSGSSPNTGSRPLYTMIGSFVAFGPITQ